MRASRIAWTVRGTADRLTELRVTRRKATGHAASYQQDTFWFFVQTGGERQRSGITVEALTLLEPAQPDGSARLGDTAARRILRKHIAWVWALAAAELAERPQPAGDALVLTAAQVRFQQACDESADLPDILCI